MACLSSVYDSTGYTPHFLLHGRKTSLPFNLKFSNPKTEFSSNVQKFVHQTKQAFRRAFELVRKNPNKNQRQRSAIYNHKAQTPHTETDKNSFYICHGPGWPNSQVFLPIARPCTILNSLIEVYHQMKKVSTRRESLVHYHFLKPFRRKPPSMNLPIRETIREIIAPNFNVPTGNRTTRSSAPQRDFDQSYYTE